jgi:5,10-methylenetetrahydrofolate reductase
LTIVGGEDAPARERSSKLRPVHSSLIDKIRARQAGICLYGFAPPKAATAPAELQEIALRQRERLATLPVDGLVVYDIQDEGDRTAEPRPFPFLPTVDPEAYAHAHLAPLDLPKVVYRCVNRDTPESFARWLEDVNRSATPRLGVLVGAPSQRARAGLTLSEAYPAARWQAPGLVLGGIAIAERHARRNDEHTRLLAKTAEGCRFFVTQAVYDVTATKSLLSDYALALRERGEAPVPIILTFSPCGSQKTLGFMKWLGIHFPRWLDNELRLAPDPLATSLALCERIFDEVWDYARDKGVPLGLNVESVSIRKAEIEASVELLRRLRQRMDR